jgi:hypothetical protein
MRQVIRLAAAVGLLLAVALLSGPSQAMPLNAQPSVRGAAETINPIDHVACWRYGWHGWGWYPCAYYRPYGYYGYGYPGYYGYYGYRRPYWGYRRWYYSDVNLKHDIAPVGHLSNGLNLYRFAYNGSDETFVGVMAQEVAQVMPDAVRRDSRGYLMVDYARVGVPMMTWADWVAAGETR